jgi:hypothetical protein
MWNQWRHPVGSHIARAGQEQATVEWFFAAVARNVFRLQNPMSTQLMGAPETVNMMAYPGVVALGVPLAPFTAILGPTFSFVFIMTIGMAGTAFAWYWLFRRVTRLRIAAAIGGLFCGFAPGVVSHATAHPYLVVLFLLPLMLLQLLRVTEAAAAPGPDHARVLLRRGAILGALIAWQVLIEVEVLVIFLIAAIIFGILYAVQHRALAAWAFAATLPAVGVALVVAAALAAIPLLWRFNGPGSYDGLWRVDAGNDLMSFFEFPTASIPEGGKRTDELRLNANEENTFLGWSMIAVLIVTAWQLRRNVLARCAMITAPLVFLLSLGSKLHVRKEDTGVMLPWSWLNDLPLLQNMLETRTAIAALPAIGLLLALGSDRALTTLDERSMIWIAGLAGAGMLIFPLSLPTAGNPGMPQFLSEGTWREYVDDGAIVQIPVTSPGRTDLMTWQRQLDFEFPIVGGNFIAPHSDDRHGWYGSEERPTTKLLNDARAEDKPLPQITGEIRQQARDDIRYWKADVLMLRDGDGEANRLRGLVNELLGFEGERLGKEDKPDVTVWDVRAISDGGGAS